jgi:RimJ/RimL family protein N-acetyltransferase
MNVILETDRLRLRRLTEADADLLFELDSDPAVMRFVNGGVPTPRVMIEQSILPRFVRSSERGDGCGVWAAQEREGDAFVGWFSLYRRDGRTSGQPDELGLAYRLRRAAWGKGYGTEVSRALIRRAFERMPVARVFATTYEDNVGSRRVMEKCGMTLVRRYRMTAEELAADPTCVPSTEMWDGDDLEHVLERSAWEDRP